MRHALNAVLLGLLLAAPSWAQPGPKTGPVLEVVKAFDDFRTLGLAVTRQGRIFASAPSASTGVSVVEVNPRSGAVTPYPDAAWNDAKSSGPHWRSAQAMTVDTADRLWLLDNARPHAGLPPMLQKLVRVDLATNRAMRIYSLADMMGPNDTANDVVIDVARNHAVITNQSGKGSLIVLNLDSGRGRHVLVGDPSVVADPSRHLLLNGKPALRTDGTYYSSHANGIALSPSGLWVYFRPINGLRYSRIRSADLADASLSQAALSKRVEYLGDGVIGGGLAVDAKGRLFAGDLEHASIMMMPPGPGGKWRSVLFANQPDRLAWADGFAISQGWLYISNSRLNESFFGNNLPRTGPFSILRVRLPD